MAQVMVVTPFRFESSPTITISMKSIIGVSVSGPDFEENPKVSGSKFTILPWILTMTRYDHVLLTSHFSVQKSPAT